MANSKLNSGPIFKVIKFSYTLPSTISNGAGKTITSEELGYYIPDGYIPFGIPTYNGQYNTIPVYIANPFPNPNATDNSRYVMGIRNVRGSATAPTVAMRVCFIREDMASLNLHHKFTVSASEGIEYEVASDSGEYTICDPNDIYHQVDSTVTLECENLDDYELCETYTTWVDGNPSVPVIRYGPIHTTEMPDYDVSVEITKNAYEPFYEYSSFGVEPTAYTSTTNFSISRDSVNFFKPGHEQPNSGNYVEYVPIIRGYEFNLGNGAAQQFIDPFVSTNANITKIYRYITNAGNYDFNIHTMFINPDLVSDQRT